MLITQADAFIKLQVWYIYITGSSQRGKGTQKHQRKFSKSKLHEIKKNAEFRFAERVASTGGFSVD
jgi:hypothetical protein